MTWTEERVLATAREAYARGRADFPVEPGRCALLVIDMQAEFLAPGPLWVPAATRMVPRLAALIDTCRAADVPVLYTIFDDTHLGLDRPRTLAAMPHARAAVRGGRSEFWPALAPRAGGGVIRKPSYGAFHDTPLDTILRNLGRDTVVITGTLTNYCCGTTARQAYERGYQVVFAADLTATDDPDMQEPELAVLRKGFARVATGEEIVGLLSGHVR